MGVRPRKSVDDTDEATTAAMLAPRGVAPTIDCRWNYFLLPPGYGAGYDLVNPGCKISPDCCSYNLRIGPAGVKVQVLLYKKAFEIYSSPPATAECKSSVKADGKLWIGWHGDIKNAWRIVLGVLGIGEDGRSITETPESVPSSQNESLRVGQNLGASSSSTSSSSHFLLTIGLDGDELKAEHEKVRERLLKSEMCMRPAGNDRADNIIVEDDEYSQSSSKTVGTTVAHISSASSSSTSSSSITRSTTGLERDELEDEYRHVTDRLLRSELCRQPAGTDRADSIIIEDVMRVVDIEAANVGEPEAEPAASNISELAYRPTPVRLANG